MESAIINSNNRDIGAAYHYHIVDFDGSVTQQGKATLLGSRIDWWNVGCGCRRHAPWDNMWLCDLTVDRTIFAASLIVPNVTKFEDGINTHRSCIVLLFALLHLKSSVS